MVESYPNPETFSCFPVEADRRLQPLLKEATGAAEEVLRGQPLEVILDAQGNFFNESAKLELDSKSDQYVLSLEYNRDNFHTILRVLKVVQRPGGVLDVRDYMWCIDNRDYQRVVFARLYDAPGAIKQPEARSDENRLRTADSILVLHAIKLLSTAKDREEHA